MLDVKMRSLHDRFVAGDVEPSDLDHTPIRPVVAESWRRCQASGADPDGAVSESAEAQTLQALRDSHPLSPALPVIRKLLVDSAVDSGVVVAVADAGGTLLWVEGDSKAVRKAESINFVPGTDWSERGAGTNAPGTALAVDREVQIRSSEHYANNLQRWSCTAVPVHDANTGVPIGVLDVTGSSAVATPGSLALVRATAVAIENHLALLRMTSPSGEKNAFGARLTVLGGQRPRWQFTDESGDVHTIALSPRHADILVLLTRHPEGLSADHLALMLDEKDLDVVTVRAEMSRLRRAIGHRFLDSKPYRLLVEVVTDFDAVVDHLNAANVGSALDVYTGALLPRSISPAIARLRLELSAGLRAAVSATGDRALLRRWLELPEGRDDPHGWRLMRDSTEPGSADRS